MKKILAAFAILVSAALVACGPSKLESQEMSSSCDVSIEVGKVLDDTISLYVGNMFFLNAKQTVNEDLFPLSASVRDPMNIDVKGRTDVIASAADFIAYLRRSAPNAVNFGIVVNEAAKNEIGFDETKTVNRLVEVFKTLEGGSVILFHEKDGQLTDAKKLF
jgi:hypothetical protein